MKYRFLIILLLFSSEAFAQYTLSFDRFQFEMSDVFKKWDTMERSFISLQGEQDATGKIRFLPPPSNGEHGISFSIDSAKKLITSFIYTYHNLVYAPQQSGSYTFDTNIVLKNIPYTEQGDTLLFDLDSSSFASCIGSINAYYLFKYYPNNNNDYLIVDTIKKLTGASRFRGSFVKLNTTVSGITPKIYSTNIWPDFTKRNFERDSIAVIYRNDLPDTVMIMKVQYYGALANHVAVTYSDNSSLTEARTILPFEKKHQLYLKFISNEGPYTQYRGYERRDTIVVDKLIRGVLYRDTLSLRVSIHGFDFDTQISTDKLYNQLEIECEAGDTVLTKMHVLYTDIISSIVFDPIPDSTGFRLVNIVHNPNDKEVEIRFIAGEEGIHEYWQPIKYVIRNFDNTLQQYTSEQFIKLQATVTTPSSVTNENHSKRCVVYPNPSNSLVRISFVSQGHLPYNISIFDELGREVRRVHDGFLDAGKHEFSAELPTGMYYVRMQAGGEVLTRKVTVVK